MANVITSIGYKSVMDYCLKMVLPVLVISIGAFFSSILFFELPIWVPYIFLGIGILFMSVYPILVYERIKVDIHENIHLFITYAGTLSTLHLTRSSFFSKIASQKNYGHIAKTAEKILYLAKSWNLGFPLTCRKIGSLIPSKIFADFLDRLAAAMDFGGGLEVFLIEEQDAIMDAYENEYKQSLENISMLREIFIGLTIAIAFSLSAALLLPLLMGISINLVIKLALLILFFVDLVMFVFIKSFIPSDELCHKLKIKDEGTKKIYKSLLFVVPICIIGGAVLLQINKTPFLLSLAISLTPMMIVGNIASKEEGDVYKRDKAFPAFIRALGSTIFARQGGVASSLGALRVHDFGVLNRMVNNLYRRLKLGSDKLKSWIYFAGETGSNLISYFAHIFAETIYLGGNARKIGEIISKNFIRLISLRSLRIQLASTLRGALYGALVGFTATVYITVSITKLLSSMFANAFDSATSEGTMGNLISTIIPPSPTIDMGEISMYLGIMILIHALVSSLILKIIDGGNKWAAVFDFVIMLWVGAIISVFVPYMTDKMFTPMFSMT